MLRPAPISQTQLTILQQQIDDLQSLSREYERNAALRMNTSLNNTSADTTMADPDATQPEPWINEPIPVAATRERRRGSDRAYPRGTDSYYPRRRGM